MECLALVRSIRRGHLDAIEIPEAPIDILVQQIIAAVAAEEWDEDELFDLVRKAWPYRNLSRQAFEAAIVLAAAGADPKTGRGAMCIATASIAGYERDAERTWPRSRPEARFRKWPTTGW